MSDISNVNSQTMGSALHTTLLKKQLSPEDFITLFLKQLTTQNPLHPADSTTMLQQMADITAINTQKETQQSIADLKDGVNSTLATSQFLSATQIIGKKVEVPSGTSQLIKDEGLAGSVSLPQASNDITVTIKDDKNQVVKELKLDPASSGGLVEFNWDGKKEDGTSYDAGYYHISAAAVIDGKSVPIQTAGAFKIKSVASNPQTGEVILNADGLGGVGLNDIIKIL